MRGCFYSFSSFRALFQIHAKFGKRTGENKNLLQEQDIIRAKVDFSLYLEVFCLFTCVHMHAEMHNYD